MVEKNVKIVREMKSQEGLFASFFIEDPDGYKIELIQMDSASKGLG